MITFIELHELDGALVAVNPAYIVTLRRTDDSTSVRLADDGGLYVRELPEEIAALSGVGIQRPAASPLGADYHGDAGARYDRLGNEPRCDGVQRPDED